MIKRVNIEASDIPVPYNPAVIDNSKSADFGLLSMDNFKEAKKTFEREFLKRKLLEYQNNITKTAEALSVGRSYLRKKLKNMKIA